MDANYSAISIGSTITNLPIEPLFRNLMRPVILANKVSSLPRPTFSPGFTRVPRCRTMMVPPGTTCPPNALNPSRCAFESRPFREVPCPFLCAIAVLSSPLDRGGTDAFVRQVLLLYLLLLRSRLLRCLFRRSLLLGRALMRRRFCRWCFGLSLSRFHLLRLRFLLGQFRSLEALPAKSDLSNAHRGVRLTVSAQLLVLLLALVVEHQDLRAAALFDNLADHAPVPLLAHLAFVEYGDNRKFHQAVSAGFQFLYSNYISGRHPVLLSTGADNRVHTSASVECRLKFSP